MDVNNHIPLFSIVIPTFNRARYISNAIKSVLKQTFEDWELIVVDDGSIDETKNVVMKFSDDRIKYHFQKNKELNAARNKGVDLSSGKYVGFLDDDDFLLPEYLQNLENIIVNNNHAPGIYRTGVIIQDNENQIRGPLYDVDLHKNPTSFFLKQHSNLLGSVIHAEIFEKIRFNEKYKLFEDIHFITIVTLKYPLFQSNYFGAVYVRHSETRINKYYIQKDKIDNCVECINHLFVNYGERVRKLAGNQIQQIILSENYLMFSYKYLKNGHLKEAIYFWLMALMRVRNYRGLLSTTIFPLKLMVNLIRP